MVWKFVFKTNISVKKKKNSFSFNIFEKKNVYKVPSEKRKLTLTKTTPMNIPSTFIFAKFDVFSRTLQWIEFGLH